MSDNTRAITDKCEQYWNEPDIGTPEIHVVLEYIYAEANKADTEIEQLRTALSASKMIDEDQNKRIEELG